MFPGPPGPGGEQARYASGKPPSIQVGKPPSIQVHDGKSSVIHPQLTESMPPKVDLIDEEEVGEEGAHDTGLSPGIKNCEAGCGECGDATSISNADLLENVYSLCLRSFTGV